MTKSHSFETHLRESWIVERDPKDKSGLLVDDYTSFERRTIRRPPVMQEQVKGIEIREETKE
jgi:hypothetical protein